MGTPIHPHTVGLSAAYTVHVLSAGSLLKAPFPPNLELGRGRVQSKLCQFLVGVQIEITELKFQSPEVALTVPSLAASRLWGAAAAPSHAPIIDFVRGIDGTTLCPALRGFSLAARCCCSISRPAMD